MINFQLSMIIVLAIVVFFLLLVLLIWHKDINNNTDIKDLICVNGRLDEKKFVRFGAWIVSTWGFIYLILENKFSEWYFMGYMTAWVGNAILDKYISKSNKPKINPINIS